MHGIFKTIVSYVNYITKKSKNAELFTGNELWNVEQGTKEKIMPVKQVVTNTESLPIVTIESISTNKLYFLTGTKKILADVYDGYAFVDIENPFTKALFFDENYKDSIRKAKLDDKDVSQADNLQEIINSGMPEPSAAISGSVNNALDTIYPPINQPTSNDHTDSSDSTEAEDDDDDDDYDYNDDDDDDDDDTPTSELSNACRLFGTIDQRPKAGERVKLQGLLYQGYGNVIDTFFDGNCPYIRVRAENDKKYIYNETDMKQQRIVKA